jgi:hypothetical protein
MLLFKKWKLPFGFALISFAFILFAISFSRFKMPHYIIMLLPLAALFTAPFLRFVLLSGKWMKTFYFVQAFQAILVLLLVIVLGYISFHPHSLFIAITGPIAMAAILFLLLKKQIARPAKLVFISIALSITLNLFLNYSFFPNIMVYQAGNEMVKKMKEEHINIPDSSIMLVELHAHSFDFYRHYNHKVIEAENFPAAYPSISNKYFLITPFLSRYLDRKGFRTETVISQLDYNVATVKPAFLNSATRRRTLDTLMLVKIYPR